MNCIQCRCPRSWLQLPPGPTASWILSEHHPTHHHCLTTHLTVLAAAIEHAPCTLIKQIQLILNHQARASAAEARLSPEHESEQPVVPGAAPPRATKPRRPPTPEGAQEPRLPSLNPYGCSVAKHFEEFIPIMATLSLENFAGLVCLPLWHIIKLWVTGRYLKILICKNIKNDYPWLTGK